MTGDQVPLLERDPELTGFAVRAAMAVEGQGSLLVVQKFDPIAQTAENAPVAREKSKVGMWLGLAVLLIVVVFVGKLILDRTPAKTSRRPGIRRPLLLPLCPNKDRRKFNARHLPQPRGPAL